MSKNLIPQIAHMLGVELGEEFKVKGYDELTYKFASDGLKLTYDNDIEISDLTAKVAFVALLNGTDEIIKLPWKPKQDETFYTFGIHATETKWVVVSAKWWDNVKNLALYKIGWIYRSQAEAEAALPAVATEMGVRYEL
jgi:hypothetical protein